VAGKVKLDILAAKDHKVNLQRISFTLISNDQLYSSQAHIMLKASFPMQCMIQSVTVCLTSGSTANCKTESYTNVKLTTSSVRHCHHTHINGAAHQWVSLVCFRHNLKQIRRHFLLHVKQLGHSTSKVLHCLACWSTFQALIRPTQPNNIAQTSHNANFRRA